MNPRLGRTSLDDTPLPAGAHGGRLALRDCPSGVTADDCEGVESAITALERHRDPECRAVGDSALARLYRGRLEFVQPTLSGMGYRRRLDGTVVMAQQGVAMIGAEQFDRRAVLTEAIARALTTDSLRPDSVARKCRRSAF